MAGISGRMDRAAYRAALCAQPRVPARVSGGGVRFFGRMPARFATGTERNVPGASVSRSVAGGRTVRVSAHGAAAAAGATLSGAVRERNAARTGGETPLNVLRLGCRIFCARRRADSRARTEGTERPYPPGPPQKPQVRTARTPPFRVPMQGAACFARLFCARKMLAAAVCRREKQSLWPGAPGRDANERNIRNRRVLWRRSGESRSALRFVLKRSGRIYSGAYYGT